jgi:hypothetical protein
MQPYQPSDSRCHRDPSLRSGFCKSYPIRCYTSRFLHMLTAALHRYLSALVLCLLPAGTSAMASAGNAPANSQTQASASPLTGAANSFVQEILSRAGSPSAVNITFQNLSQLTAETQQAAQDAILNSLRGAGVRLVKPEMALADVQVTFSEDWQGYVWIAQIKQGPGTALVISRLSRPERVNSARTPTLTLRKSTIWIQDGQMLDFFVDNQNLVILEPSQVSVYAADNGQWRQRYTLSITRTQPWPRDLRGKLLVNGLQINAYLPGTLCAGSLSPPSLDCHSSDDPWSLDQGQLVAFFSARRNFFNGILAGPSAGVSVVPFFSGATWPGANQRQWVFAGTDGRARFYLNDLSTPAATFNSWGSNLAIVHSGCSTGWQLLVSSHSDSIRPDSVEAVEFAGREAQAVSPAVDLAGPVSAMWTSGKNSEAVNGVVQLPSTGKYEAFTLTVSCN